ncbi:FMN-dependent L-lactate dehydrogenase LldD [Methylocystis sp. L43]|uniref:FMN-dependent L-lactate dehydrogenase LldD n=1 Tax=unclassified Methylocystis TaxID=2625913 RepID=UPI0018C326E2|nr:MULTISPECIES: FMN-dependent L-lactate dehydrogenase LldD [unclassified Methylocystis]MBG0799651.1 FMN-dependent L-lactate dehydrogenase LldD [Methylocystis sp. L43]MBG0807434.1 FMN-dependent L-lactate dehydrogenase LldD [Methylocystis sp. H15]
MIVSSASDYRKVAQRKLPRFLFDYIDGGANAEDTLQANVADLRAVNLRQRVLKNVSDLSLATAWFGQASELPVILAPVGLTGLFARRGEVQMANAAANKGVPCVVSTLSVCSLEEVTSQCPQPIWFQLYVLKDRGFMQSMLERAQRAGVKNLVFTVDLPVHGSRYRDAHSGLSGPYAMQRRVLQAMTKPAWALDVGIRGRPHDLGNISKYLGKATGLQDYIGWLGKNIDPSISWSDLEWIREFWKGPLILKGILDPEDARDAVRFGANGIIVSNHGGRQLDGALSTAKALPPIADAVGSDLEVFVDSGVRSGLDVVRMLALGAKGVLLGRAAAYALAAAGQGGVENMLEIFAKEMRVAMTLTGVTSIAQIDRQILAS